MPLLTNFAKCPKCGTLNSTVQITKPSDCGGRVRRRVCRDCSHGWYTFQPMEVEIGSERVYWRHTHIKLAPPPADLPQ